MPRQRLRELILRVLAMATESVSLGTITKRVRNLATSQDLPPPNQHEVHQNLEEMNGAQNPDQRVKSHTLFSKTRYYYLEARAHVLSIQDAQGCVS